jgi:H+/gluconate symporter-like permease
MDPAVISLIGIFIGLAFLVIMAYRGFPLLFISPLAALIIIPFSGVAVIPTLTGPYMAGFARFATSNFLIFLLSAIFGKLLGDSGAAKYIAYQLVKLARKFPGKEKVMAVISLMVVQAVLTYGGISLFVVVFTLVSIGKEMFEELDVPWSMYTCATLGSGCFTMTMLPGSPAIQNLIPMEYLGTDAMAAPVMGILSTILAIVLGVLWIIYLTNHNAKKGLGFYPTGTEISKVIVSNKEEKLLDTKLIICLAPSIVLLVVLNVLKQSPITSLAAAIVVTYALFFKQLPNPKKSLADGAGNALNAIGNTCAVTGFGGVVAAVSGYELVLSALDKLPGPPIVQLIVAVNMAAGVTGSASGGLGIAMNSLSQRFLDMGLNPQIIHRIASMSSGGLDSLPHNGAVINTLTITRLGHKYGYLNYLVMTVIIPLICTVFAAILGQIGVI